MTIAISTPRPSCRRTPKLARRPCRAARVADVPTPAESLDRPRVQLCGVGFDPITEREVTEHVLAELDAGRGGRIVT